MPAPAEIFRRLSHQLKPVPNGVEPRILPLPNVRAVLFDVYGTLFISGSGDIGSTCDERRADAVADSLAAVGVETACTPDDIVNIFKDTIARYHDAAKNQGIEYPEVDIVEIWADTLHAIGGESSAGKSNLDYAQLACEFEARANPVWPMPGLESVLAVLNEEQIVLGIVSNAQFFTPELFPALLNRASTELGFDPQLTYFSYQHRHAKPSTWMYSQACKTLASRGIWPAEVLHVGNDMRNDVWPAAQVGFRTALFAGDARSLRLRSDDPQLVNMTPDAIVTELAQILELIDNE